jgi:cytosine deaminase
MLLRGAVLGDGRQADVRVDGATVVEVGRALVAGPGEEIVDLDGYVLLPAPAEPHAHLDKALTADLLVNRTGDLLGAIEVWHGHRRNLTEDDLVARGAAAARALLGNGATAIRTHVDVAADVGLLCIEALAEVKAKLADEVDLQIVALVAPPTTGPNGRTHQDLVAAAFDVGADVVGGCPHLELDPVVAIEQSLDLAERLARPVDLHMDETLDASVLGLADLARSVHRRGLGGQVTASHCVSLGVQPVELQVEIADLAAAAGIAVVTLPQTNLYLQGRDLPTSTPRGLTALRPLLAAGVTVAAGGDNLQDPFNPVGRADPLEAASLLVMAGHLSVDEAYEAVSTASRRAMGLPAAGPEAGAAAELLAVRARSLREAVAFAPADRVVVRRGRVLER